MKNLRPINATILDCIKRGVAAAIVVMFSFFGRAGLTVPYAPNANTLHLWHLDEPVGSTNCFDAVTNNPQTTPLTFTPLGGPLNPPAGTPTQFVLVGVPSEYPVLTNSVQTTNRSTCLMPPYIILTNSSGTATNFVYNTVCTNLSDFVNTNTGAFTWEALVHPLTSLLTPPNNEEIICADNTGLPSRGWQFRFNTSGQLEYNNIAAGSGNDFKTALPSAGIDAVQPNNWYHVALTFTGTHPTNGDTPNVLAMYWTLFDGARTHCDVLATFTDTNNQMGIPVVALCGSARGNPYNNVGNGEGFDGNIDEVRISNVCLKSNEMAFNNLLFPEPIKIGPLPTNTFISYGKTLTLSPTVSGSQPMLFQWTKDGVPLSGQTNQSLVISNITFAANGNYQLFGTNTTDIYGTVGTNSNVAGVSVGAGFDQLYGTGMNNDGTLAAGGTVDQHWLLTQDPDPLGMVPNALVWSNGAPVSPYGGLVANGPSSVWISSEVNATGPSGNYRYETHFLIDQGDVATAVLSGNLYAFNPPGGTVFQAFLNGVETDITLGGAPISAPTPFVITNGLQAGSNTLDLVLSTTYFGGFRADLNGISQALPAGLPVITNQPASQTVHYGSDVTLSTVALGRPPLSYQWFFNNNPIPGANSRTLTIHSATFSDQGSYQVMVSNDSGPTTSAAANLTVSADPQIISQTPTGYTNALTLFAGVSPAFSVSLAVPPLPTQYQWYSNDVAIAGATNTSYSLTNLPVGTWGNLDFVATNSFGGSVTSTWAIVVIPAPTALYPQTVLASTPLGFWRLNEPDNGTYNDGAIANDYGGGYDGLYTNTVLGQTGYNPNEPSETAAAFGFSLSFTDNDAFGIPINLGESTNFTVEAWVDGFQQTVDAGLVSKGFNGAEQFSLDCGSDTITASNPVSHSYRFLVRDASGASHAVNSSVNPKDTVWHHLVGVCDETDGYIAFYIDGTLIGTNAISSGGGILTSSNAMIIGSKPSTATGANNLQFVGYMDDVAVYPRALNASEIANHYYAIGIGAKVTVQPTNTIASQNGTAVFSAQVKGTPPVSYQWYSQNSGVISGATNATLVLSNLQTSDSYYLQVGNAYGSDQSSVATLTVVSGAPQIYVDTPPEVFAMPNQTGSIPVTAFGTLPFSYQWQFNGQNLTDNSRITGSQSSNVLSIANAQGGDAGSYQAIISNGSGSVTSSVSSFVVGSLPLGFNYNGQSWSASGSASVATNLLSLTNPNNGGGLGACFFSYPQYVGAFKASFTYQAGGNLAADGATFCIQNDLRGASALGASGGGLGVGGITPSVELELNLFTGNNEVSGYTVLTNGLTGANGGNGNYKPIGTVNLKSGDPIGVNVFYQNGSLALTFTDAVAGVSFSTNLSVGDITRILGTNAAYVGFTGAYGGSTSVQTVSDFTFVSIPPAAISFSGTNAVVSWPGNLLGYLVQQNPSLTTTNWTTVTNLPAVLNGGNQVTVPKGGSNAFFRLILQ